MTPFDDKKTALAYEEYDSVTRTTLLALRELIFETADRLEAVEKIEEGLKWGQPSYAPQPRTGTPIRLGIGKNGSPAMFVHCQTSLVSELAADNGFGLETVGNREVVLPVGEVASNPGVRSFVRAALCYHLGGFAVGFE